MEKVNSVGKIKLGAWYLWSTGDYITVWHKPDIERRWDNYISIERRMSISHGRFLYEFKFFGNIHFVAKHFPQTKNLIFEYGVEEAQNYIDSMLNRIDKLIAFS